MLLTLVLLSLCTGAGSTFYCAARRRRQWMDNQRLGLHKRVDTDFGDEDEDGETRDMPLELDFIATSGRSHDEEDEPTKEAAGNPGRLLVFTELEPISASKAVTFGLSAAAATEPQYRAIRFKLPSATNASAAKQLDSIYHPVPQTESAKGESDEVLSYAQDVLLRAPETRGVVDLLLD